jgi:hypothetical protein
VRRNAPSPPSAVPSFGLDENTGTTSHGEDLAGGVPVCVADGGAGDGDCADAGADHRTAARSNDSAVTRCLTRPAATSSLLVQRLYLPFFGGLKASSTCFLMLL